MAARVEDGLSSPKPGQAFVPELGSDVGEEIPASRFGREHLRVLFGRKLEVAVDVTAVSKPEERIECSASYATPQELGFDRLPVISALQCHFESCPHSEIRGHIFGRTRFDTHAASPVPASAGNRFQGSNSSIRLIG